MRQHTSASELMEMLGNKIDMKDEEHDYKKTNRENAISPKRGLFWCWKCDRQIVSLGRNCPLCGAKPRDGFRLKKERYS